MAYPRGVNRRTAWVLGMAALAAGACRRTAPPPPPAPAPPVADVVASVVADFRGVVVLLADGDSGDARPTTVARMLHEHAREALEALAARVAADGAAAGELLGLLEASP